MLKKEPKRSRLPKIGKALAFLTGLEIVCFVGSYAGYRKLNHDPEFRLWVGQTYYPILDAYYRVGEYLGDSKLRTFDQQMWGDKLTK